MHSTIGHDTERNSIGCASVRDERIGNPRKRPPGISVLAILNLLGGLLCLVLAAVVGALEEASDAVGVVRTYFSFLGISSVVLAWGLWKLRNWARVTSVILYGLSALTGALVLLAGDPSGFIQVIVAVSIAVYLCRDRTAAAFNVGANCRTSSTSLDLAVQGDSRVERMT